MRVGPFELRMRIGRGAMGEVWSAVHQPTDAPVAVKILAARWSQDRQLKASFREEVRAVAALDHPHIIRVLDYGEVADAEARDSELVAGLFCLVMEHVAGGHPDRVGAGAALARHRGHRARPARRPRPRPRPLRHAP